MNGYRENHDLSKNSSIIEEVPSENRYGSETVSLPNYFTVFSSNSSSQTDVEETEEPRFQEISVQLSQPIKQSALSKQALTLETLLIGAWAIILSRYSYDSSVYFGIFASKSVSEIKASPVDGSSDSFVPVKVEVEADRLCAAWLSELRSRLVEILQLHNCANQVESIDEQSPKESQKESVSCESILDLRYLKESCDHEACDSASRPSSEFLQKLCQSAKAVDIPIKITAYSGEKITLNVVFDSLKFDSSAVTLLLEQLKAVVEGMVVHNGTIADISWISANEQQKIVFNWNQTQQDYPRDLCVHRLFEMQARRSPKRLALVYGDRHITYGELNQRANQLARHLRTLNVRSETLVGIYLEQSVEAIVALLAIIKAGGAYLPLDITYPQERLMLLIEDAQVPVILTKESLREKLPTSRANAVYVDSDWNTIAQKNSENLEVTGTADSLAYVIYTSGSTGKPKGVAVIHRAIARLVVNTNYVEITANDRVAQASNFSFDAATFEIWGALLNGASLYAVAKDTLLSPPKFSSEILNKQLSIVFLTTAMFNQIACEVPEAFNSVKYLFVGGEVMDPTWIKAVIEAGPPQNLANIYGPTENTTFSCWYPIESVPEETKSIPIGKVISNSQAYILDLQQNPVPVGVPGELYFGGDGLARGYLNRPELTQNAFIRLPSWLREGRCASSNASLRLYKTGDMACYLPDGNIEYLGRTDHQVKIRGFRIELKEVKETLSQHPDVQDVVVIVREDTPGNKRLVAYLVCHCSTTHLRAFSAERLPPYMVPSAFVNMDALPMTSNGKVNRRVLPKPEQVRPYLDTPFSSPQTKVEIELAKIWLEALGLDRVGIHDDFFELGGHSLLATQIFTDINITFQVDLPISSLLDSPTISGLSKKIEKGLSQGGDNQQSSLSPIVPDVENRYSPFSLNDMQRAYWLGRSSFFELGNVAIHLYFEVNSTDFEIDRFNEAWNQLVKRHDMLRAVVLPNGQQQILTDVPKWQVQVTDLRDQDKDIVQQQLDSTRSHLSHLVKPVEQWPQFEIQALQIDEQLTRLYLSFDGWCFDGRSYQVLFKELVALYEDPSLILPPLNLSFRDYVLAVQKLETSSAFAASLKYWAERVTSLPPAPDLPLAINPKTVERPRFKRYSQRISPEVWRQVKSSGQRLKLTPTIVLMTAYAEVLTRWSKTPRFAINVPRFNRVPLHAQVNEIIGEFASFTLLEVDHSTPDSFANRAHRLQRQLWQDLEHQYVSGIRVLREIAKFRNVETKAVSFPVVFTTAPQAANREASREASSVEGTSLGSLGTITEALTQTPQVHIDNIYFEETDETLVLNWDVVEALFPSGMIETMFTAYVDLLMQLAQGEAMWLETGVQKLVPAKQLERRAKINNTASPIQNVRLHDLFVASAKQHPNSIAVVSGDCRITYGQLHAAASRLAQQLTRLGVRPNHLVPVVMNKGWEQVVGILGVLISGGAYVPIDPDLPSSRLQYLLSDTQASLVLTQAHLVSAVQEQTHLPCISVQPDVDTEANNTEVNNTEVDAIDVDTTKPDDLSIGMGRQRPEDLAYVIYTSGTTGTPKGVMINHLGAVNTVLDINNRFQVSPTDRVLAISALSFDLSVYDVFGTLAAGGTIVIPDDRRDRDPNHWIELIQREKVSIWNTVPALMQVLVDYVNQQSASLPQSLRLALLSGDWLPLTLPERIQAIGNDMDVISLGGATEASIWSILYPIQTVNPAWKSIPYGKPMVNQQFHVLNHALEPCPVWVPGQMYIGGMGLAQGYWQNEQKTASSFVLHPKTGERLYRTGDLGRYLPDGNIEFLGRVDFQLKIRGYRIESGEIEAALMQHPDIKTTIISVFSDVNGEQQLVAYYRLTSGIEPSREHLRQWLKERLPHYMIPLVFIQMDAFPLTANGKVNRRQLPEPNLESSASPKFVAPRTPVETVVAGIWADIADLETVGVYDDFFLDLSGNSLLAIQVATAMRETFQIEISLRLFFEAPTVAQQADAMLTLPGAKARLEKTAQLLLNVAKLSDSEIAHALSAVT